MMNMLSLMTRSSYLLNLLLARKKTKAVRVRVRGLQSQRERALRLKKLTGGMKRPDT